MWIYGYMDMSMTLWHTINLPNCQEKWCLGNYVFPLDVHALGGQWHLTEIKPL